MLTIPAVQPYPMPRTDLLQNCATWKPDARRCSLLIHDMQRYFLAAFRAGTHPLVELIRNIDLLRQSCYALDVPVFYSVQPGTQTAAERGLLIDFWGAGIRNETEATGIVDDLTPYKCDVVISKRRYSAFHRTSLLSELRKRRRDQLIVCGVYAHIGCLATAIEAFMYDVQPFLATDAMADFSEDYHVMALNYAARRCAVILPTTELIAGLHAL